MSAARRHPYFLCNLLDKQREFAYTIYIVVNKGVEVLDRRVKEVRRAFFLFSAVIY